MAGDTPGASTMYVIIQESRVTGEIQIWLQENGDQDGRLLKLDVQRHSLRRRRSAATWS